MQLAILLKNDLADADELAPLFEPFGQLEMRDSTLVLTTGAFGGVAVPAGELEEEDRQALQAARTEAEEVLAAVNGILTLEPSWGPRTVEAFRWLFVDAGGTERKMGPPPPELLRPCGQSS